MATNMLSGTLSTNSADSVGVNLTDEQKNTVYDTSENGKLDTAERYTGTNTDSYVDQLSDQYDQTQSDYDTAVDTAVDSGAKALENVNTVGQESLDTMRSQAVRDYKEAIDTREAVEAANGNRDGIGHVQYGELENALSQRMGDIQTAADELTQNVSRQIVALRQQGDYQKADALYSTTQAKLQAMYEEQLRIDTNLRSNYETITSQDMEDKENAAEEDATNLEWLRSLGQKMIEAGVLPSDDILEIMGLSKATVQSYLLGAGYGSGGGSYSSGSSSSGGSGSSSGSSTGSSAYDDKNVLTALNGYIRSGQTSKAADTLLAAKSTGTITSGTASTYTSKINAVNNYTATGNSGSSGSTKKAATDAGYAGMTAAQRKKYYGY